MYSSVLILREKNEKTMKALRKITRKGWCILLDQKMLFFLSALFWLFHKMFCHHKNISEGKQFQLSCVLNVHLIRVSDN